MATAQTSTKSSKKKKRKRKSTRSVLRDYPRGILTVLPGKYGFVQTPEGQFFIDQRLMCGAFDGDLVEVAPVKKKHPQNVRTVAPETPAARVVRVIEHAHDTLIGRYEVADPFGVVIPEDPRIHYDVFTMRADYPDIEDGTLVRVRILQFPSKENAATGVIEEVLGRLEDLDIGIDLIIARHKVETEFSAATLQEAEAATLDEVSALAQGYRDIRERFVFTIDPHDAKDFDDALSLDLIDAREAACIAGAIPAGLKQVWRLGVHIADVSHYVPWDSSIDLDARRRATSVYLTDRVVPMLPEALSNELCSLKPQVLRRAFSVDMYLDDNAVSLGCDMYPSLICSNARLSYEQALALIEDADTDVFPEASDDLVVRLKKASIIGQQREKLRVQQGNIEFSATDAKIIMDDEGHPLEVELHTKTLSTQLIEEAMILANETVASYLFERSLPCIYRDHEPPDVSSLEALVPVFQEFDWFNQQLANRLCAADPHAFNDILQLCLGRPEHDLVSMLLVRAMKRAVYSPHNDGHFGLGSKAYCHFTSPIRRYPDLVVHRMLRAALTKKPAHYDQEVSALSWISEHSSDMERVADACERESLEFKLIQYMTSFVGQAFSGIIAGVTASGLYVRLENTVEGFLPARALGNEFFSFDQAHYTLTGEESGKIYRLGQHVAIVVRVAEPLTRNLEFILAGEKTC